MSHRSESDVMEGCDRVVRVLMSNGDPTIRELAEYPQQGRQHRWIAKQALFGDHGCPNGVRSDAIRRRRRNQRAQTSVVEEAFDGNDDLHGHLGPGLLSGGFEHQLIDPIFLCRECDKRGCYESCGLQFAQVVEEFELRRDVVEAVSLIRDDVRGEPSPLLGA